MTQVTLRFKTAYGNNPRKQFQTSGPSLTQTSFQRECDINTIMARFEKTGVLEHRNNFQGQYADFTNTPGDYHEAMNAVLEADEMFGSLPARVRARFHNDAGAFLDFVGNPDNADEMVKLGLATARQVAPQVLEPSDPPRSKKAPEPAKKDASDDS